MSDPRTQSRNRQADPSASSNQHDVSSGEDDNIPTGLAPDVTKTNRPYSPPGAFEEQEPGLTTTGPVPVEPPYDGHVTISAQARRNAYEHQVRLRDDHMRRLLKLERKLAVLGISADPSIEIEAEDIRKTIAEFDAQIFAYGQAGQTRADRTAILNEDKQREALAALSRITGIPVDQIKLVDIVLGSVVLIVEMPIAGAARLVAMQLLRHPMLRKQGFAKVALDGPSNKEFDQALSLELVKLDAETPESKESLPYPLDRAKARLRVTLAEEGE